MSDSFEKRLSYGKEAEDVVAKKAKKLGVQYELTSNRTEWSPEFDKENGDIWFARRWGAGSPIKADVKRSGISFDAIDTFKGNVFIIANDKLDFITVFPAHSMRKYKKTCLKKGNGYSQLRSGAGGLKFSDRRLAGLYKGMSLEAWLKNGCQFNN